MISVNALTKVYKNGKGIFDVTFEVKQGEVFGFLGPNGAGKTTTIRQLMGFTNADSGSCVIGGFDTRKETEKMQRILGYVPGEIAFFDALTGYEFIDFLSKLRGFEDSAKKKLLMERFELDGSRKIRKMSKGMKQKVGLIAAFCHNPDVLLLDEPTSGLDPLMQRRFIELIEEEKKLGKTILMSSHIFDEVDRTCDRAAIIKEGRIVAQDAIQALKSSVRKSFIVTFEDASDIGLVKNSGLDFVVQGDNRIELFIGDDYKAFLETLTRCHVKQIDAPVQSLEQIFINFYGEGGK